MSARLRVILRKCWVQWGTCVNLRREWVEPWHVNTALKVSLDQNGRIEPPEASILRAAARPPWSVAPKLRRAELAQQYREKFISGNSLMLSGHELIWTSDWKSSDSSGGHEKIIVSCDEVMFLCELDTPETQFKLQPRKRIV